MQEKHKRKRVRARNMLILVFVFLYIPSLFHWIYGRNISTEIIRNGTIEDSVSAEGYIIRDSTIFKAPFDGRLIPDVGEGERVPANARIATIFKMSSVELLELLEKKNLDIIRTQNEKARSLGFFSGDIKKIEDEIGKKVISLVSCDSMNSLAGIKKIRDDINDLVQKKAAIVGSTIDEDVYINTLKKEKEELEKQVKANTKQIATSLPGIVSYYVDEYEEILNPSAIKKLSPQFLDKIAVDYREQDAVYDVAVNKPFAKVINGIYYYIAIPLGAKEAELFNAGDEARIRIHDVSGETKAKIEYKSEKADDRYVIVVKLDRFMSETSDLRKVNVDVVINLHEGLKVPLKSLLNIDFKNRKAQIALVKSNCATIRDVVIKGWDDEFAIIENPEGNVKNSVSLYDTYIINPENIEEGQIINR